MAEVKVLYRGSMAKYTKLIQRKKAFLQIYRPRTYCTAKIELFSHVQKVIKFVISTNLEIRLKKRQKRAPWAAILPFMKQGYSCCDWLHEIPNLNVLQTALARSHEIILPSTTTTILSKRNGEFQENATWSGEHWIWLLCNYTLSDSWTGKILWLIFITAWERKLRT